MISEIFDLTEVQHVLDSVLLLELQNIQNLLQLIEKSSRLNYCNSEA